MIKFIVWLCVIYLSKSLFGSDADAVVAIAIGGVLYLILDLLTKREERLLSKDLESLNDQEYEELFDAAEKNNLIERHSKDEK